MAGGAEIIVSFVADLTKLASGAKEVEKTGKAASKGLDWKGVAKWTAAAGGIAAAGGFIVTATKSTEALAKQTMALQRATGLDTKTASEWVGLLQQRGIGTDAFTRSMLSLSKAMEKWRAAGVGAPSVLKDLGVSFDAVQKGDVGTVLSQVADGLAKIQNPAQRAATAAKLFGKAGTQLLPILGKGSAALQDNLDGIDKYGAALGGDTLKAVQDQTKAQRELQTIQAGLAVTIGSSVLPVQAELYGVLAQVLGVMAPLLQNSTLMTIAVSAGAVAWGAYKVATIAASVAGSKEVIVKVAQTAATWAQTAATWALNFALTPQILIWGAIVVAIVAVIAVAILLAKNWGTVSAVLSAAFAKIKTAALAVWNWIRANWPLLLAILTGPIGLAVLAIQRNWTAITNAFNAGVNAAKSALGSLRDFLNTVKGKVVGYLGDITSAMAGPGTAMESAVSAVKAAVNDLIRWLRDKVGDVSTAAGKVASALKSPINSVISAWNGLAFHIPSVSIPKVDIPGVGKIGGGKFGGQTIDFPNMPQLARGGVLTRPTLFVGGEAGREIVTPEKLLREIVAERGGDSFTLVMQPRTADAADVAYAFRRLELLRTGR